MEYARSAGLTDEWPVAWQHPCYLGTFVFLQDSPSLLPKMQTPVLLKCYDIAGDDTVRINRVRSTFSVLKIQFEE